jgi:hypothetical protein
LGGLTFFRFLLCITIKYLRIFSIFVVYNYKIVCRAFEFFFFKKIIFLSFFYQKNHFFIIFLSKKSFFYHFNVVQKSFLSFLLFSRGKITGRTSVPKELRKSSVLAPWKARGGSDGPWRFGRLVAARRGQARPHGRRQPVASAALISRPPAELQLAPASAALRPSCSWRHAGSPRLGRL